MKKRAMELCLPCAIKLRAAGITLRKISAKVDNKITCEGCGCRRFGASYERL